MVIQTFLSPNSGDDYFCCKKYFLFDSYFMDATINCLFHFIFIDTDFISVALELCFYQICQRISHR